MKHALLFSVLSLATFWPAGEGEPADQYPKNPNVDVLNYAFHLALSDATDRIEGRAVIDVAIKAAGERELRFDLVGPLDSDDGELGMRV